MLFQRGALHVISANGGVIWLQRGALHIIAALAPIFWILISQFFVDPGCNGPAPWLMALLYDSSLARFMWLQLWRRRLGKKGRKTSCWSYDLCRIWFMLPCKMKMKLYCSWALVKVISLNGHFSACCWCCNLGHLYISEKLTLFGCIMQTVA